MSCRDRLVALLVAVPLASAQAQSSQLPLYQWQHTAWSLDVDPQPIAFRSLVRSADGYLWLSSGGGLIRFDGVHFTVVDSTTAPELRPGTPAGLFPRILDRTGRMWIHSWDGRELSYADGHFRVELRGDLGSRVSEDRLGRIWVTIDGRLRVLEHGRLGDPRLPAGVPDTGIFGVVPDTGNGVWIGTDAQGLWHVTGSTAEQVATGRVRALLQSSDGTLWTAGDEGPHPMLWRFAAGQWSQIRLPGSQTPIASPEAVEAPDGSVWFITNSFGIVRWRDGIVEQFSKADGLSSNFVNDISIDSSGTVWLVTDVALDRLRPAPFATIERRHGLPSDAGTLFAVDSSGAIWTTGNGSDRLYLLDGGIIRGAPGPVVARQRVLPIPVPVQVLAPSTDGGVWLGPIGGGLFHVGPHGARVYGAREGLPTSRLTVALAARDGTLWIKSSRSDFGRFRNGHYRAVNLPAPPTSGWAEGERGRIWIAPGDANAVVALAGDSVVTRVVMPGGAGQIVALAHAGGDTLWASTLHSLFRIADGHVVAVPLPALAGILVRGSTLGVSHGQLWVVRQAGIARVPLADLNRVANGESGVIRTHIFDALDGLPTPRAPTLVPVPLQVGPDGRVWVSTPAGLAVTDGVPVVTPHPAPQVHIEELTVGGVFLPSASRSVIAPNPQRLAIHYGAPTLDLPEQVRVQYRLEGADPDWVDGTPAPRIALYNQLRPGQYHFRVRAWNEESVDSVTEAVLSFRVLPAWYQSWWFAALCIAAVAAVAAMLAAWIQRSGSRREADRIRARFEAVIAERSRIARELHDTLLQGFTGITLQLDGVRSDLEERAEPAAGALATILQRADHTLREARNMVWDIRLPELNDDDLSATLEANCREVVSGTEVVLRHVVSGTPRPLPGPVTTAILRICREAVVNAMKHGDPDAILVRLSYEPHRIVLEVQDNGRGTATGSIQSASSSGHWGISGMRERALSLGGSLEVRSQPGQGLLVTLSLPAEPLH